jgi:transposase
MAYEEITMLLGGWEGFELVSVRREPATGETGPVIELALRPVPNSAKRCGNCGEVVAVVHDVSERRVRDLPILEADTWLVFPRARLACPRCGPTVEAVPWLDRYQRLTTRLAAAIARLAQVLPIKHVAAWFAVGWATVKAIDRRGLGARLGPVALDGVRVLALDEFALHRGQRYATVVADAETRRVLWVGEGRDRAAVRAFFTLLGPTRCAAVEAVVMDMSAAFAAEVRAACPQAALVYDRFHVQAGYNRDVVDRVRVDETTRVAGRALPRGAPGRVARVAERRELRGSRWLLLPNRAGLAPADRVRLYELLAANVALFTVYVLKEDLARLWTYTSPGAARRCWADWEARARESGIPALARFADRLAARIDGVLNHCRYPLNTGFLEGINNKIKVLKRMAYGFRDHEYFFLKIRAAFPGIPR